MSASDDRRRGSYAKGIAKREEILTRALDVIAREGYSGASVKQLATAVGLSQAGLLHYFDSKEELFTAILRKRDEVDRAQFDGWDEGTAHLDAGAATFDAVREGYLAVIRHNSEVPGLVQLFSRMAVDATDPQHPAHGFFLNRSRELRGVLVRAFADAQAAGALRADLDPGVLARMFQALADGLQLQWMLDPDVDMTSIVDSLFAALTPGTPG